METIVIIGLGYVGLPLAVEFGKKRKTIGFDINKGRIAELKNGFDRTLEVDREGLVAANQLHFTYSVDDILDGDIYIVTVPTPIDDFKNPDLTPVIKATETVGEVLKKGNIVIYESTVYPGVTEEVCVPILESKSNLTFNKDFFCGYSPERINPGDKVHTLTNIKKVTSGSNPEIAKRVDSLYKDIITAGTHLAPSIKVAEAAKVIENSQRDINIAFVNELSLIFERMNIDTYDVLEAAGTKWNFLKFTPGLVGGHCIGVDPYYLTYKAESLGYHPQVILSGRRINDNMGVFVANKAVKLLVKSGNPVKNSAALVLGITFKENCPDIRNTRVVDVIQELEGFGIDVDVYDPCADAAEVKEEYGIELVKNYSKKYDLILLTVSHNQFKEIDLNLLKKNSDTVVLDVKSFLPKGESTARL
jgi:UDP-N-acetyl-D-galactosamine dehydrogenase